MPVSLFQLAANAHATHMNKAQAAFAHKNFTLGLFHCYMSECAASFCDKAFPDEVQSILQDGHTPLGDTLSPTSGRLESLVQTNTEPEKQTK